MKPKKNDIMIPIDDNSLASQSDSESYKKPKQNVSEDIEKDEINLIGNQLPLEVSAEEDKSLLMSISSKGAQVPNEIVEKLIGEELNGVEISKSDLKDNWREGRQSLNEKRSNFLNEDYETIKNRLIEDLTEGLLSDEKDKLRLHIEEITINENEEREDQKVFDENKLGNEEKASEDTFIQIQSWKLRRENLVTKRNSFLSNDYNSLKMSLIDDLTEGLLPDEKEKLRLYIEESILLNKENDCDHVEEENVNEKDEKIDIIKQIQIWKKQRDELDEKRIQFLSNDYESLKTSLINDLTEGLLSDEQDKLRLYIEDNILNKEEQDLTFKVEQIKLNDQGDNINKNVDTMEAPKVQLEEGKEITSIDDENKEETLEYVHDSLNVTENRSLSPFIESVIDVVKQTDVVNIDIAPEINVDSFQGVCNVKNVDTEKDHSLAFDKVLEADAVLVEEKIELFIVEKDDDLTQSFIEERVSPMRPRSNHRSDSHIEDVILGSVDVSFERLFSAKQQGVIEIVKEEKATMINQINREDSIIMKVDDIFKDFGCLINNECVVNEKKGTENKGEFMEEVTDESNIKLSMQTQFDKDTVKKIEDCKCSENAIDYIEKRVSEFPDIEKKSFPLKRNENMLDLNDTNLEINTVCIEKSSSDLPLFQSTPLQFKDGLVHERKDTEKLSYIEPLNLENQLDTSSKFIEKNEWNALNIELPESMDDQEDFAELLAFSEEINQSVNTRKRAIENTFSRKDTVLKVHQHADSMFDSGIAEKTFSDTTLTNADLVLNKSEQDKDDNTEANLGNGQLNVYSGISQNEKSFECQIDAKTYERSSNSSMKEVMQPESNGGSERSSSQHSDPRKRSETLSECETSEMSPKPMNTVNNNIVLNFASLKSLKFEAEDSTESQQQIFSNGNQNESLNASTLRSMPVGSDSEILPKDTSYSENTSDDEIYLRLPTDDVKEINKPTVHQSSICPSETFGSYTDNNSAIGSEEGLIPYQRIPPDNVEGSSRINYLQTAMEGMFEDEASYAENSFSEMDGIIHYKRLPPNELKSSLKKIESQKESYMPLGYQDQQLKNYNRLQSDDGHVSSTDANGSLKGFNMYTSGQIQDFDVDPLNRLQSVDRHPSTTPNSLKHGVDMKPTASPESVKYTVNKKFVSSYDNI